MLNAAVPRPRAMRKRFGRLPAANSRQAARNGIRSRPWRVWRGFRASCFHSAMPFSSRVARAQPWITWIRRIWLKSLSSAPKPAAPATMPSSSIT